MWCRVAVTAGLLVASAAYAHDQVEGHLPTMVKVADGVFVYEHLDPTKAGVTANNLVVITDDGVLVADGQGTVENTTDLVQHIARLTPQPIRYVVVGSEHGDHRGGDSAFPSTATFIAHPFSRANLERQAAGPRRANAPAIVVPTETVSDKRVLTMGGREIQILFLGRAHTGGDLEVYLPNEKILFMSEVFSTGIFPSMANGYPTEWIAALRKVEQMDVRQFVPAHNREGITLASNRAEQQFREALERVVAEGRRLHDAHVPVDDAASQADFGEYATWWRKTENAPGAIKRVYMELDGELDPKK
jgi:cyclase